MGFRINTNIAALQAHTSATLNNKDLDNSLSRLSSGLRINKAADDASGMAIADSLNAQATGLGQAIDNANDGVAVVQTADGALDEYISIINTVRTKAIQAASDGQNETSREAIQRDISALLEEAQNIATTTSFNGQQLLDGSFTNKAFHIGAYAGETVSLSVSNTQTDSLGSVTSMSGTTADASNFVNAEDLSETAAGYILDSGALTINGTDVSSSLNELSSTSLMDAASIAAAISDATGLVTDASNSFTAAGAIAGGTIAADTFKINGVAIAATTVQAGDSDGALVRAINDISDQTGVTASLDSNNKLVLESEDGSNISITNSTATTEVQQVTEVDFGAAVATGETISVDVNGSTYTAAFNTNAATTYADLIATVTAAEDVTGSATGDVITFTADAGSPIFTVANASNTTTSTSATVTTTTEGVEEILAADASDTITGLTADNLTDATGGSVAELTSASTTALVIAEGDLVINGVDLAGTYGDGTTAGGAQAALEAAIQDIDGFEDSSIDNVTGAITLVVNDGQDLNIAGVTANSTFGFTEGITNESAIGTVEIFSDEAVSVGGTAADAFGFTSGSNKVTDNGSSLNDIDVTTRNGAEIAILIADSALEALDTVRSELGSVQNQLESTIRNISVTQVNVTAAESQIRDVDFAEESANFSKYNILAQSGTYAMSQANSVQQNVLSLLQ
jgi:flagellin